MATFKLTISYDGAGFAGWAAQPERRTVQGELESALRRLFGGEPVSLTVAGRTDTGVHARAQVASFTVDREVPDQLAHRLNGMIGNDVAVIAAESVPEGFDARRWARSRSYRYRLHVSAVPDPFERGRALWWPYRLDRERLEACAALLVGEHDFTAFTPTRTEHVRFRRRVIRAEWVEEGVDDLVFRVEAESFLRKMIRILVGTMLEVGTDRRSLDDFASLLAGAPRELAGQTAAPHGLYFEGVDFADGPVFTP